MVGARVLAHRPRTPAARHREPDRRPRARPPCRRAGRDRSASPALSACDRSIGHSASSSAVWWWCRTSANLAQRCSSAVHTSASETGVFCTAALKRSRSRRKPKCMTYMPVWSCGPSAVWLWPGRVSWGTDVGMHVLRHDASSAWDLLGSSACDPGLGSGSSASWAYGSARVGARARAEPGWCLGRRRQRRARRPQAAVRAGSAGPPARAVTSPPTPWSSWSGATTRPAGRSAPCTRTSPVYVARSSPGWDRARSRSILLTGDHGYRLALRRDQVDATSFADEVGLATVSWCHWTSQFTTGPSPHWPDRDDHHRARRPARGAAGAVDRRAVRRPAGPARGADRAGRLRAAAAERRGGPRPRSARAGRPRRRRGRHRAGDEPAPAAGAALGPARTRPGPFRPTGRRPGRTPPDP